MKKGTIAVIGAGKVGTAMAYALDRAGYLITGIASRTESSAQALAQQFSAKYSSHSAEIAELADIVLLAVPDRAITQVAGEILAEGGFKQGQAVFHLCGSQSAEILEPVKRIGAFIGSMHPLQTFSESYSAAESLPGTYFAVDGDETAVKIANDIVQSIGGKNIYIAEDKRVLYHAAACMASNYMVVLLHNAMLLLESAGIKRDEAVCALAPILRTTLANAEQQGTIAALTGPVIRGDAVTVARHLNQIRECLPSHTELYRVLGSEALGIAKTRGSLNAEQENALHQLLK